MEEEFLRCDDLSIYRDFFSRRSHKSLWQSLEWKSFQEALGREVRIYLSRTKGEIHASALIVIDRTSFGLSTWDIQRGPLWKEGIDPADFIHKILNEAKRDRCVAFYLSSMGQLNLPGFKDTSRHEQPEATRIIDLTITEEEILAQMKQKGRYNIKVAKKHQVTVEESSDIEAYASLSKETAKRDGFVSGNVNKLRLFLNHIPQSFLLLAREKEHYTPIAGLIGTIFEDTGIYYYGASSSTHRRLMAPYLLQWEAMKKCKQLGCKHYDLFGVAPPDSSSDHTWAGITSFKEKFGGEVLCYEKERELILKPYVQRMLRIKRTIFR